MDSVQILAPDALMMQLGPEENCDEMIKADLSVMGFSVTGTIVSLVVNIKKPPLIDTFIAPEAWLFICLG